MSQPTIGTAPPRVMGVNVSRIRKLFIPALDEGAKASKNPMMQMEIEVLRARKKVAGSGVVDPHLDRLDSLCAMVIVTKFRSSGPNTPTSLNREGVWRGASGVVRSWVHFHFRRSSTPVNFFPSWLLFAALTSFDHQVLNSADAHRAIILSLNIASGPQLPQT